MSNYAKYQIEKEVVSVDNGQTWKETGNQRHGKILDVYPSLAACEDTDCDLKMSQPEMFSGKLPEYLCADETTVYHEWVPQGILQEGTFSGGLMGCNGIYDSAPAYLLDNVATNCGSGIKIGDIICTPRDVGGVQEMYCRSRFNSFGDGKGVVLGTKYNCCGCCFVGACVDLVPQKLFPWVDKDNTLMLKISHYTKEHCSEDWVLESEDFTNIILERWIVVGYDQTTGSRLWQHQVASELYTPEEAETFGDNCQNVVKTWVNDEEVINESDYLLEWKEANTNIYNIEYLSTSGIIEIPRITIQDWFAHDDEESSDLLGRVEMIQDTDYTSESSGNIVYSNNVQFPYKAGTVSRTGYTHSNISIDNLGTAQFPVMQANSHYYVSYPPYDYNYTIDQKDLSIASAETVLYYEYYDSSHPNSSVTKNYVTSDKGAFVYRIWSKNRNGDYNHYFEPVHIDYSWMPDDAKESLSFEYLHDRTNGMNYSNGYKYIYKCSDGNWYWDNDNAYKGKLDKSGTTLYQNSLESSFDYYSSSYNAPKFLGLRDYTFFKAESVSSSTFQYVCNLRNLESITIQNGITNVSNSNSIFYMDSIYSIYNRKLRILDFGSTVSAITCSNYILGSYVYINNLEKIIFRSITPPTISVGSGWFWDVAVNGASFSPYSNFGVYVPNQSINAYEQILPNILKPFIKPLSEVDNTYKAELTYSFGHKAKISYDDTSVLKQNEIRGSTSSYQEIQSVAVYNNQDTIGENAFVGCTALTTVNLPPTITKIDNYAFYGCHMIDSITLDYDYDITLGVHAFDSSNPYPIFLPVDGYKSNMNNSANWKTYKDRVFAIESTYKVLKYNKNTELYSAVYQDNKRYLESKNVSGNDITTVIISSEMTSGSSFLFNYAPNLEKVRFGYGNGSGFTNFGASAFRTCTLLTTAGAIGSGADIEIPSGMRDMSSDFNNSYLTRIDIPSYITTIKLGYCYNLTKVIIPSGKTSINDVAFQGNSGLTSVGLLGENVTVEIPDTVTSIGNNAFTNCNHITSVTLSNNVTNVGDGAFRGDSSSQPNILSYVDIGYGVTSIGRDAFAFCRILTFICRATTPPTLGNGGVFYGSDGIKIYVPDESVDAYKAASRWKSLASKIHPISEL